MTKSKEGGSYNPNMFSTQSHYNLNLITPIEPQDNPNITPNIEPQYRAPYKVADTLVGIIHKKPKEGGVCGLRVQGIGFRV